MERGNILKDRLKEAELRRNFSGVSIFSRQSLKQFYHQFEPTLKETTFRWMLYELKSRRLIEAVDRGVFTLHAGSELPEYAPAISKPLETLYKKLMAQFPFADICIWETSLLNEFLQHQVARVLTVVEAEAAVTESLFHFLKEKHQQVFLAPSRQEFEYYVYSSPGSIVIKKLVSQSPLLTHNGIRVPKLEKLLVDLFAEPDFFYPYQGNERTTLFCNAFTRYKLSPKTIFRYAQRRKCREGLAAYLQQNKLLPAAAGEWDMP